MRSLGDEATTEAATKNVQRALSEDLGFHPQVAQEARIRYVVNNYDVSEDVAKEILNARQLIDKLSGKLANSNIPNGELEIQFLKTLVNIFEGLIDCLKIAAISLLSLLCVKPKTIL